MTNELQQLPRQLESNISVSPRSAEIDLGGDIREFMTRPPHWLLRSGTTVLAAVLGLLLLLSVIIKYPDTIIGRVSVTGTQPVMEVVARQGGHLESLRVREGQRVKQGEILAVMQSAARPATVFAGGSCMSYNPKSRKRNWCSIVLSNRDRTLDTCRANTPISLTPITCFKAGWPMITRKRRKLT